MSRKFFLETMELERFCMYSKRTVLDFRKLGPGLHYVKGVDKTGLRSASMKSNGTGKTTLYKALSWCLFGVTIDGLRGPDIRPWVGSKGTTTVAATGIFGNARHTIKRTHSPNLLTLDGDECGQAKIHEVTGMNLELFKHTIAMGQDEDLFFQLKSSKKMELFSEALNLNRWERRAEGASKKLAIRRTLAETVKSDLAGATSSLETVEALLKRAQSDYDYWAQERLNQKKDLSTALEALEKEHKSNQARLDQALLDADGAATEAEALWRELEERQADLATARHFYNKAETKIEWWRHQCKEITVELAEIGEGDKCQTCGQSLRGTALAKRKEVLRGELAGLKKIVDAGIPHEATEKVTIAKKKETTIREHYKRYEEKRNLAETVVKRLTPEQVKLEVKVAETKRQLAALDEGANPHSGTLRDLKKRKESLEDEQAELQQELKDVEALIARTQFAVKGFKEIPLMIMEEVLDHLEVATNAILEEIGLEGWEIRCEIEKETKSGTIKPGWDLWILSPENSEPVKWACWSGGTQRRLLVAGALALSEVLLDYVGLETNLEALDEPTQFIVEEGIKELIEFLAERAETLGRTILYTDHAVRESSRFTTTIEVALTKNGSQLSIQGE